MIITSGNTATGRHDAGAIAENLHLLHKMEEERREEWARL